MKSIQYVLMSFLFIPAIFSSIVMAESGYQTFTLSDGTTVQVKREFTENSVTYNVVFPNFET